MCVKHAILTFLAFWPVTQIFTLHLTGSCPQPSLRQYVSRLCVPEVNYHCLYDAISNKYTLQCRPYERFPAGSYVFLEGGLNSRSCPSNLYQSQPYNSSDFDSCLYRKSSCDEEGQVVHRNGTFDSDRSCRCDYRRGYAFVTQPSNLCFCIPSTEDCSCYLKRCSEERTHLTPDYECIQSNRFITCPEIANINYGDDLRKQKPVTREFKSEYSNYEYNIGNISDSLRDVGICVFLALIAMMTVIIVFTVKQYVKEMKSRIYNEVSARDAITSIMANESIVIPSYYEQMENTLDIQSSLILNGRRGSGKSTLALRLAGRYFKKNYIPWLLTENNLAKRIFYPRNGKKYIIIIECPSDYSTSHDILSTYRRQLQVISESTAAVKLILIEKHVLKHCSVSEMEIKENRVKPDALFEILYNSSEKKRILLSYLHKNKKSLTPDITDELVAADPYFGYPLMCSSFCENSDHLKLGVQYFQQAPKSLVDDVDKIRQCGASKKDKAYEYSVLVYMLLSNKNHLKMEKNDLVKFKKLHSEIFRFEPVQIPKNINEAAVRLCGRYLEERDDFEFTFIHNSVYLAIMISYGCIFPSEVVSSCELRDLKAIFRPVGYKPLHDESCLLVYDDELKTVDNYAQRLCTEISLDKIKAKSIGSHLRNFSVEYKDTNLLSIVIDKIRRGGTFKSEMSPVLLEFFTELIDLIYDYHHLSNDVHSFALAWWFLCTKSINDQARTEQLSTENFDCSFMANMMKTVVDHYGNTLLHYFIAWNGKAELMLLYQVQATLAKRNEESKMLSSVFNPWVQNSKHRSPLEFAAYLGRCEMFIALIRIIKLVEYYENKLANAIKMQPTNIPKLMEQGQKLAGQVLLYTDQCISIDFTFCKAKITFGGSKDFFNMLDELEKKYIS